MAQRTTHALRGPGSCRGLYHFDRHPVSPHSTVRCPQAWRSSGCAGSRKRWTPTGICSPMPASRGAAPSTRCSLALTCPKCVPSSDHDRAAAGQGQVRREPACRPGLDPGCIRPAATHHKPVMTCGFDLSGSRRLVADDDIMCPECARPDCQLGNECGVGSGQSLRRQAVV